MSTRPDSRPHVRAYRRRQALEQLRGLALHPAFAALVLSLGAWYVVTRDDSGARLAWVALLIAFAGVEFGIWYAKAWVRWPAFALVAGVSLRNAIGLGDLGEPTTWLFNVPLVLCQGAIAVFLASPACARLFVEANAEEQPPEGVPAPGCMELRASTGARAQGLPFDRENED